MKTKKSGPSSNVLYNHTLERKELLFTFAIISDSHVNPEENKSSSPWESNKLANARTRYVIKELNRLTPDFVIHLGDLIHPVPTLPSYEFAAKRFHELLEDLEPKIYLVPGNHDVGDKPAAWTPADSVTEEYIDLYSKTFGKHFYSFKFLDCCFVMVNCQIMNSGLKSEKLQKAWLEKYLSDNSGKRTFLFTHYPPFITQPYEEGHYDNIDEPARSWLLDLTKKSKIEAVFAGHVHNFFYNRHGKTDFYNLPSVTFFRHDYSELYRVGPTKEYGRNDEGKLGYFFVKVYKSGHVSHAVRTYGAAIEKGRTNPATPSQLSSYHTKEMIEAPVGVDLRHPWAEVTEMPYNGALDEFYRKKARNDYTLMALWEMGIRKLRVPSNDLLDASIRERMYALKAVGHEFTVFNYGLPQGRLKEILAKDNTLVRVLEVILPWHEAEISIDQIRQLKNELSVPIYFSKVWSSNDAERDGSAFKHFINHGFNVDESGTIEAFLNLPGAPEVADGFVFRVGRKSSPWLKIQSAKELAASCGVKAEVHVRLASENPAQSENDDLANANRVAETISVALGVGDVDVFLDTFADLDRGYFPRTGLVDRRYNPRAASFVFRYLHSALEPSCHELSLGQADKMPGGRLFFLTRSGEPLVLVLPRKSLMVKEISVDWNLTTEAGTGRTIDLVSGLIMQFSWRLSKSANSVKVNLSDAMKCYTPTLLDFGE
jgi:3',5'-cyclic AMP phosphodiesterase CpdA